ALGYAVPVGLLAYVRLIDHRPWIGALLGLVGVGFVGARFFPMTLAYLNLLAQGGPIRSDCKDVIETGVRTRHWVTLTGGMIPGIIRPQSRRVFPVSTFLGKVDHTDVALVDSGTEKWIDLRFDGLNNGPQYWGPSRERFEGTLTRTDDWLWNSDPAP